MSINDTVVDPATPVKPRKTLAGRLYDIRMSVGNFVATIYLIFICLGAVCFAIISFSAFNVQEEIRKYQRTDPEATLAHIHSLANQWRSYEAQISTLNVKSASLDSLISTSTGEKAQFVNEIIDARHFFVDGAAELTRQVSLKNITIDSFNNEGDNTSFVVQARSWQEQIGRALTEQDLLGEVAIEGASPWFSKNLPDITFQNMIDDLNQRIGRVNGALAGIERVDQGLGRLSTELENIEEDRDVAINTQRQDEQINKPELKNLYYQILFFGRIPFGDLFAGMPQALLVPLLALAMGGLGSAIYMAQQMTKEPEKITILQLIFRPMIGMLLAFAMFILAHGGMLIVSQSGAAESTSGQLNPYFISFLGIISGLVSESATRRITVAAESFFQSTQDAADRAQQAAPADK